VRLAILALCACAASAAGTVELPPTTFYSGNDVYDFCQHDRAAAFAYVAGLYDGAAHAAFAIVRDLGRSPKNDAVGNFALKRVVGYVKKPAAPRLGFGGTSCFAELDSSRRSPIPTSGSIQRGSRLRPSGRPVSVNRPEGPADDVSS
jgi:hypothetical protein